MIRTLLQKAPIATLVMAILLSGGVAFAAGETIFPSNATQNDLRQAMRGEAYAYLSYLAYAHAARLRGNTGLATLLESTANTEHAAHFVGFSELLQFDQGDRSNLKSASSGEADEGTNVYPRMAVLARLRGDSKAADWFSQVAKDEISHHEEFEHALVHLAP